MKHILFFLGFFFFVISFQSCSKRSQQVFEIGKTITIPYHPDMYSPLESFVSKVTVIPLETNDNCLIGQRIMFSVKFHQNLFYISFREKLLVFDLNGNFVREIGRKGAGPGEFIEVRDFIFTDNNTIELLDFLKIDSYTMEGKHIDSKRFNYMGTNFHCNPMNFCRSYSSGYYLWGGVIYHDEELREKCNLMYRINSDMQIENGYFSQKYGDGGWQNRFKYYKDITMFAPSAYDYNVYQIDNKDSIKIRYSFDFGEYSFDSSKDVDRQYISHEGYVRDIHDYHETERFIYFHITHQNYIHNLLYSKITGQTYIQSLKQAVSRKDFGLYNCEALYNDQLVAVVDVSYIKHYLKRMSHEEIKKWGFEELHKLDDEANPILIIYKIMEKSF